MELLVATWTLRLALVGSLAVIGASLSAGATLVDAVERAVVASFALTFLGRQLVGWLETPEQKMLRLRARRGAGDGAKATKAQKAPKPGKAAGASKPAAATTAGVAQHAQPPTHEPAVMADATPAA